MGIFGHSLLASRYHRPTYVQEHKHAHLDNRRTEIQWVSHLFQEVQGLFQPRERMRETINSLSPKVAGAAGASGAAGAVSRALNS